MFWYPNEDTWSPVHFQEALNSLLETSVQVEVPMSEDSYKRYLTPFRNPICSDKAPKGIWSA
jgi:hypothetical protein